MDLEHLKEKSAWLRRELFEMVVRSRKGHFPSSSSISDVIVTLFYGGYFKYNARSPHEANRDRIFISKGHAGMALYPILADLGYVPKEELVRFTKVDGIFRFYPDPSIPGIEAITGSLGHGMGIAAGHALSAKRDGKDFRSYVMISDGECYEGSTWETAMFASHHQLDHLVVIVDRNGCCILDYTERCVRLDPLEDKWQAFGWHPIVINGHSYAEITRAFDEVISSRIKKPIVIISKSVKGKGISFMENEPGWHNRMPDDQQIAQARQELASHSIAN